MPIDLPPNSLGPKPTKKQMELLKKMAESGATVHRWHGSRMYGAYIRYAGDDVKTENINIGTMEKFHDWGWLDIIQLDWRGNSYAISERGKKVIEKGETRK